MEKALEIGKVSATGSYHLFIGTALSNIVMAVGTIILARLISPEEYGLYSIALIPSLTINLFRDLGINSAMTKYISQFRASNKNEDVREIIAVGLLFEVAIGLVLSFLCLFTASTVASNVFNRPELSSLIAISSITIFSGALLAAAQSSFVGFERMGFSSITTICQSVVKSVASPLFVVLVYGALGAVLGYVFSFIAASIAGLAILYLVFFKKLMTTRSSRGKKFKTLKTMLKFGVPISISTNLTGFLTQFYSFMMAFYCSDIVIGNYRVAINFSVVLTFLVFPITTVLFPVFAKINPQDEPQLLENVFVSSTKYTAMLLVPATMAIMVLSKPMISTLFGDKWIYAPQYLTLYVITYIFAVSGGLNIVSFLAGLGETKMLVKISGISLLFGIIIAFLLIPPYGILGVIIGEVLSGLPSGFWGLHWIWKHYRAKADFKSSTKIFMASLIAATITYLPINFLTMADWVGLVIGAIVFLTAYILSAPLIGAITQSDINNLRVMFSSLGHISKLTNIPIVLAERVVKLHSVKRGNRR